MKTTTKMLTQRIIQISTTFLALMITFAVPAMADETPPGGSLRPQPYDYLKAKYSGWNTPHEGQTRYAEIHAVLDRLAAALPPSEAAIKQKIAAAKVCLDEMWDQLKDDNPTDLTGAFAALAKYYREHLQEIKAAPESDLAKAFYFAGDRNDMQGEQRKDILNELHRLKRHSENWDPEVGVGQPTP